MPDENSTHGATARTRLHKDLDRLETAVTVTLAALAAGTFVSHIVTGTPVTQVFMALGMGIILAQSACNLLQHYLTPTESRETLPAAHRDTTLMATGMLLLIVLPPSINLYAGLPLLAMGLSLTVARSLGRRHNDNAPTPTPNSDNARS